MAVSMEHHLAALVRKGNPSLFLVGRHRAILAQPVETHNAVIATQAENTKIIGKLCTIDTSITYL
jgi:hypothetical protein